MRAVKAPGQSRLLLLCLLVLAATAGFLGDWWTLPWEMPLFWAAAAVGTWLVLVRGRTGEPRLTPGRVRALILFSVLLNLGLSLWLRFALFSNQPVYPDEFIYRFQARILASGQLSLDQVPAAPYFFTRFILARPEGFTGGFPPGWPLVLAMGELVGLGFLVPHLLTVGSILLVSRMAGALASEPRQALSARAWAAWLLGTCPWVILQSATLFSHSLSLFLTLAVLTSLFVPLLRAVRIPLGSGLGGGLALGLLFLARPFNAVLLVGFLGLAAGVAALRSRSFRPLVGLVVPCLPALLGPALLLLYNGTITGAATLFPMDRYFAATELSPTCHRVGFGDDIGCMLHHGGTDEYEARTPGHHPADAVRISGYRLKSLASDLFGHPLAWLLLLPLILTVLILGRGGPLGAGPWALGFLLLTVLGYGLFYFHGIAWGARFYFETLGLLVPAAALGLAGVGPGIAGLTGSRRMLASAALALGLSPLVSMPLEVPLLQAHWAASAPIPKASVLPELAAKEQGDLLILLSQERDLQEFYLLYNENQITDQGFGGRVLYALDRLHDPWLVRDLFPGRRILRWDREAGRLIPEPEPGARPETLRLELMQLWPFWNRDQVSCSLAQTPRELRWVLACRADSRPASFGFDYHLPPGSYRIRFEYQGVSGYAEPALVVNQTLLTPRGGPKALGGSLVQEFDPVELPEWGNHFLVVVPPGGRGTWLFSPKALILERVGQSEKQVPSRDRESP